MRHKGFVKSRYGVDYFVKVLSHSHADSATRPYVGSIGTLWPCVFESPRAASAFAKTVSNNRDPEDSDDPLRSHRQAPFRKEGTRRVANICYAFHGNIGTDKSLSIAALLFRDDFVLRVVLEEQQRALQWLARQAEYRVAGRTIPKAPVCLLVAPELASRDGAPYVHTHGCIPNVTLGHTGYCAVDFRPIARLYDRAHHRALRHSYARLARDRYAIDVSPAGKKLSGVPEGLIIALSPASQRLDLHTPRGGTRGNHSRARERDDHQVRHRPQKIFRTRDEWIQLWEQQLGTERVAAARAYYTEHVSRPPLPATIPTAPEPEAKLPDPEEALAECVMPSTATPMLPDLELTPATQRDASENEDAMERCVAFAVATSRTSSGEPWIAEDDAKEMTCIYRARPFVDTSPRTELARGILRLAIGHSMKIQQRFTESLSSAVELEGDVLRYAHVQRMLGDIMDMVDDLPDDADFRRGLLLVQQAAVRLRSVVTSPPVRLAPSQVEESKEEQTSLDLSSGSDAPASPAPATPASAIRVTPAIEAAPEEPKHPLPKRPVVPDVGRGSPANLEPDISI